MRTYEKTPGIGYYHNYTEENVASAVTAVNNSTSKKTATETLKKHAEFLSISVLKD